MNHRLRNRRLQFLVEGALALLLTGLVCCAALSNLLDVPTDWFPQTSDAMGHMAKVRFLAECMAKGEFTAWFPYWYNGAALTQYYPPLSYWFMAPIYLITDNAMRTFQVYCFAMLFIGGMGVWWICRTMIGRWCGLSSILFFCLQPYLLRSFFAAGLVAQGPIIALIPWHLYVVMRYARKGTKGCFAAATMLCTLMILGHAMTAFMVCLCELLIFFLFVLLKKIELASFFEIVLTIFLAGTLTAFWSLVGATGLETPGIPYLLEEATLTYTATIEWFTTLHSNFFFFGIPISVGFLMATLIYLIKKKNSQIGRREDFYIYYLLCLTALTFAFSFGQNLPLFEYFPMAKSLVPGRILALTSASAAVLCAYLLFSLRKMARRGSLWVKMCSLLICLALIGSAGYFMNPFEVQYGMIKVSPLDQSLKLAENDNGVFSVGRYGSIGAIGSEDTFFPYYYGYNSTIGWNIEGTQHNQALWNESVAGAVESYDYVAKNLAYWNVRTLYLVNSFDKVKESFEQRYPLECIDEIHIGKLYHSTEASTYFLEDPRNALLFGNGTVGVSIEYPFLISDRRTKISEYQISELDDYKLIYLCEPVVDTKGQQEELEYAITKLIERGVTVIIEPAATKSFPLFGVTASDMKLESKPFLQREAQSRIETSIKKIEIDENIGYGRVLTGLDEVWYRLYQNEGRMVNDVIGTKKIGQGEVVFLGKHISQLLPAVYIRNWGMPSDGQYPHCSKAIEELFMDIFRTYGVTEEFWPSPFLPTKAEWDDRGVKFEYEMESEKEITVSVTYSPRWKAKIDGESTLIEQRENLITLKLPAGKHIVQLRYGMTGYGVFGYLLSGTAFILFLLSLWRYDIMKHCTRLLCKRMQEYLQV